MEKCINIACPCCYNKRLFDLLPGEIKGIISIKCPKCRGVVSISLHNYKNHSNEISAIGLCAESPSSYKLLDNEQ